nr:RdgB/HAM1 family non-canonical purine NTP pyrophosphatase [Rhodospirillales bacterium]
MTQKFIENSVVSASHNLGKVSEISKLLVPLGITTISARELGLAEPDENGQTFIENAEIKALAAAKGSGLPALADDSGLVIPILGGDPGIYSARWALDPNGKGGSFTSAVKKIKHSIEKMGATSEGQKASFACALSLCWPDEVIISFEGFVHGSLTFPPRGNKGFGYDPIFIPENHQLTFGEMDPIEKHQISHRAQAFKKLIGLCFN